jgi:hypothetical protein
MENAFKDRDLLKKKDAERDKQLEDDIKKYNDMIAERKKNLQKKKMNCRQ